MGIGNRRGPGTRRGPRATHYPSWGLETSSSPRMPVVGNCSLPLMGIGNFSVRSFDGRIRITSLPLMGIGNLQPSRVIAPADQPTSLPLMGIGNMLVLGLVALREPFLITPHGDWKLSTREHPRQPAAPHYPSWGLETHPERRPISGQRVLITPHGDWKHDRAAAHAPGQRALITPHYPSWGLETRRRREGLAQRRRGLITPHGDWKRAAA